MSPIAARLATVEAQIAQACEAAGRPRDSVELVAVSKTVEPARIQEALRAGQAIFGENYAQDLRDKVPAVPGARWHFLGPLQRNKVKYVVGAAELIHSVDSLALAQAIDERARLLGRKQRVLIQVNIGDEPQKAGVPIAALPQLLDDARRLSSLLVEGLMCIPPEGQLPRPYFAALRELAQQHHLPRLSMGMSADFPDAIAEGATLVRVGTAIFGARSG